MSLSLLVLYCCTLFMRFAVFGIESIIISSMISSFRVVDHVFVVLRIESLGEIFFE